MIVKMRVLSTCALAVVTVAGMAGCSSNPEKKESAPAPSAQTPVQAPAPAPVVQAPAASAPVKAELPVKGRKGGKAKPTKSVASVPTAESAPVSAPTAAPEKSAAPTPGKIGPGMNARGEVVDSSKVESGYGQKVKGVRDYDGEITGRPAPGSKFTRLQIGMPLKQVTDLIGQPSDEGSYITGKAFIPFFFGGDRHRQELVYKGQGRLIFAGGSMGDLAGANLIWIIHNANEPAYR